MKRIALLLALSGTIAISANAQSISPGQTDTMKKLIAGYEKKVKAEAAKAAKGKPYTVEAFTVENGRQIYLKTRNWEGEEQPACATCHTDDPKNEGKHAVFNRRIQPLAPSVNPDRFTNAEKVEKNFSIHCRELYSRDCTAAEKGHFLTYLLSVK